MYRVIRDSIEVSDISGTFCARAVFLHSTEIASLLTQAIDNLEVDHQDFVVNKGPYIKPNPRPLET